MKNPTGTNSIFIALTLSIALLPSQSCQLPHLPNDNQPWGPGTMSVVINGVHYDFTNVRATGYMGLFCKGTIPGHELDLGLGTNLYEQDTLRLTEQSAHATFPVYFTYDTNLVVQDSSMIIITACSGNSYAGTFRGKLMTPQDTLDFEDGAFNALFVPSD